MNDEQQLQEQATPRKLASLQRIVDVHTHPNADALDIVRVLGWDVVTKRDEYKVGDWVVFLEIDSWVPHRLAPFLSKGKEPRVYNGIRGEKLKTQKLRGVISQGLVLKLSDVFLITDDGKYIESFRGNIDW